MTTMHPSPFVAEKTGRRSLLNLSHLLNNPISQGTELHCCLILGVFLTQDEKNMSLVMINES